MCRSSCVGSNKSNNPLTYLQHPEVVVLYNRCIVYVLLPTEPSLAVFLEMSGGGITIFPALFTLPLMIQCLT